MEENNGFYSLGRGIYLNSDENFFIWINEEDHLSIIGQSNDHQMSKTYDRMIRAMNQINQDLEFQQHQRLGYLTFSPMNIGTALRVDIHIKLFNIDKLDQLTSWSKKYDLDIESTNEKNIYRVTNLIRLGRTEFHLIRGMWNNIQQILAQDLHQS